MLEVFFTIFELLFIEFWNEDSASYYATIRTYIETCNRNGVNIYDALLMLCIGKPYSLKEILSKEV